MNEDCPFCRYEKSEENCRGCFEGSNYRPKQTNADRIRAMRDEELAEWAATVANQGGGSCAPSHYDCTGRDNCVPCWLDWLKQEAEKPADTTFEGMIERWEQEKAANVYDKCERHEGCTVEIWSNSETGKTSIGWWKP